MIVAATADRLQFVTQPAHADLAGRFADRWGNDRFEPPEPAPVLRLAAYAHDTGWSDYDLQPHLDDGEPIPFTRMPPDTWTDLYDDGIDAVRETDPYAGLLVSMHGAGLRKRRYGLSPEWPDTPPEYEAFVDRQERRQRELLDEARAAGRDLGAAETDLLEALHTGRPVPDGYEGRLWTNYRLLQAWDALSLAFCTTAGLPDGKRVERVPLGGTGEGQETTLSLSAVEDADEGVGESEGELEGGIVRIDPYPFDEPGLTASVAVRTVDRDAFDTDAQLRDAYYRAERERRAFTLVDG